MTSADAAASRLLVARAPLRSFKTFLTLSPDGSGTPKVTECPLAAHRRPSVPPTLPAPRTAMFIFPPDVQINSGLESGLGNSLKHGAGSNYFPRYAICPPTMV